MRRRVRSRTGIRTPSFISSARTGVSQLKCLIAEGRFGQEVNVFVVLGISESMQSIVRVRAPEFQSTMYVYVVYDNAKSLFVLSWSPPEARASACFIGSLKTAQLQEVATEQYIDLLVDSFDKASLADRISELPPNSQGFGETCYAARTNVAAECHLHSVDLHRQLGLAVSLARSA